jgi:hypothetical protein
MGRHVTDNESERRRWESNPLPRFCRPLPDSPTLQAHNELRVAPPPVAHHLPTDKRQMAPDLALIVERWTRLPEDVRAQIVAIVEAVERPDK